MGGGGSAPGDELSASDEADVPREGRGGGTADARAGNLGGPEAAGLPGRGGAAAVVDDGFLAAIPPVLLGGGGRRGFSAGFDLAFTRGGGKGGGGPPLYGSQLVLFIETLVDAQRSIGSEGIITTDKLSHLVFLSLTLCIFSTLASFALAAFAFNSATVPAEGQAFCSGAIKSDVHDGMMAGQEPVTDQQAQPAL